MKISVLGCGRWGSFIAWYLCNKGYDVCSWGPEGDYSYEVLRTTGKNEYVTLDKRIRLTCVADGTCLAAIEPGDLYALFSNLLDQAIDAAAQQQNDRRMIDLLVCRRQGFAVINVIGPALSGSQSDHGRRHSYELKVARRVVQKYSGTMATEPRGELFAVKIVLPLTRG